MPPQHLMDPASSSEQWVLFPPPASAMTPDLDMLATPVRQQTTLPEDRTPQVWLLSPEIDETSDRVPEPPAPGT